MEMFDEAKLYEIHLPFEEECAEIRDRLGIADMGRFPKPLIHEDSKSTIPLWTRAMLESDENQKVNWYAIYSYVVWFNCFFFL